MDIRTGDFDTPDKVKIFPHSPMGGNFKEIVTAVTVLKLSLPSWLFPRRQPRWRVSCLTSLQSVPQALLCPWLMVCSDSFSTSWWSLPETVWTSPRKPWSPPGTSWSCRRNWRSCCTRWVFLIFKNVFFPTWVWETQFCSLFLFFFVFFKYYWAMQLFRQWLFSGSHLWIVGSSDCPWGHYILYCSFIGNIELKLPLSSADSSSLASNGVVILYYYKDLCSGQVFDYIMFFIHNLSINNFPAANAAFCKTYSSLCCTLKPWLTPFVLRKLDNLTSTSFQ